MDHDAPALRLSERPFIRESSSGVWPFHVHDLIRSAIRSADDSSDDRWSEQDWRARPNEPSTPWNPSGARTCDTIAPSWSAVSSKDCSSHGTSVSVSAGSPMPHSST